MNHRPPRSVLRAGLAVAAALLTGIGASCGPRAGAPDPPAGSAPPTAPAAAPATPAALAAPPAPAPSPSPAPASRPGEVTEAGPAAAFEKLTGRWLRPDGGYVLEVRSVSPEGTVDASYLNPRPIRVARADARRMADLVTLYVELRDVNYPGSIYRLAYDPARDVLAGTYFQALQQQTFDVEFVRR